jgi:hypothetical protein
MMTDAILNLHGNFIDLDEFAVARWAFSAARIDESGLVHLSFPTP